jgi:hypothetical protein
MLEGHHQQQTVATDHKTISPLVRKRLVGTFNVKLDKQQRLRKLLNFLNLFFRAVSQLIWLPAPPPI